ncbi:hypothetical protein Tco_0989024 [Tanacetum coccineum]|uniref:Uncharacterized protein n=1 Tax=Tanacetum coccineum TaxID=301880 RepID=A0ABQ5ETL2_9ASTR
MSNRHQELASPKQTALCCTKALATPEQTATGKEISNLLTADSLLKTIREEDILLKIKSQSTIFREIPYPFDYPMRRITMEEILATFIDEGRRKHEDMEIFIKEFRISNELLLKTQSNLLSELKIEVNELSKVVSNILIPKNEVKGVTTRGGKMTSEATRSKEINETGINKNEPPRFEQDVQEKLHDDGVENKCSSILEKAAHSLVKP